METKKAVITPGGRVGDDASHNESPKVNWVEKRGGLPRYIRIVRNGLMKDGKSEGQATALAVAAMKRWARGGDNVTPKVQAAAAAALAQREAMKASKSDDVSDVEFKELVPDTLLSELYDSIDNSTEVKDGTMQLETKQAPGVTGLNVVDEEKGIVEAFVSVTNIVDKVKDVIQPGAYTKTLAKRTPKGVYAHDWKMPVSKALEVKELLPGDPGLPENLRKIGAGALKVKMQFNLDTQRGRDAYSDVVFYKDEQEWSIGYQVPAGSARMDVKTGQRNIDDLELYEYSPVLFGAAPHTSTASVKDALAFKDALATEDVESMSDVRFKELCDALGVEFKGVQPDPDADAEGTDTDTLADPAGGDPEVESSEDTDEGEEDYVGVEDDYEEEKALPDLDLSNLDYELLVALSEKVEQAIADIDFAVLEAQDHKSLSQIITGNSHLLGDYADEMKDAAEAFDTAYELDDADSMNDFGNDVLEVIEKGLDEAEAIGDKAVAKALRKVAAAVAAMAPDDEEEEDVPDNEEEEDKPLPPKGKKDADDDLETKRQFTAQERQDAPTMPGTDSYPIVNMDDLHNAVQAWGRCKPENRGKLKAWLMKRAKELHAGSDMMDRIAALDATKSDDVMHLELKDFDTLRRALLDNEV